MTLEELRKAAHEAPMNKVHEDHKGRKSLGTHSMAWASASREYMKALEAHRDRTSLFRYGDSEYNLEDC